MKRIKAKKKKSKKEHSFLSLFTCHTLTQRERHTQGETHRDTERERHKERETQRDKDTERGDFGT